MEGTVKWFHNAKGYGFIGRDDGPDVFVHYTGIVGEGYKTLEEGDTVEFEIVKGPKGQQAANVSLDKKKPYAPPRLTTDDPKNVRAKRNSTPTLLICDDNPNIRYLLRAFVESRTPYKICGEAAHGEEAIEQAKKLQPDLILLDFSMPVRTAAAASVLPTASAPRMQIIIFSILPHN